MITKQSELIIHGRGTVHLIRSNSKTYYFLRRLFVCVWTTFDKLNFENVRLMDMFHVVDNFKVFKFFLRNFLFMKNPGDFDEMMIKETNS